jgi:hypothetical protein
MASGGHGRVLYVCYEHSEEFLLERLIAMESALAGEDDPISVGDLRNLLAATVEAGAGDEERGIGELLAELAGRSPCCSGWAATRSGCSWSRRGR